jgi:hypothetical protein
MLLLLLLLLLLQLLLLPFARTIVPGEFQIFNMTKKLDPARGLLYMVKYRAAHHPERYGDPLAGRLDGSLARSLAYSGSSQPSDIL